MAFRRRRFRRGRRSFRVARRRIGRFMRRRKPWMRARRISKLKLRTVSCFPDAMYVKLRYCQKVLYENLTAENTQKWTIGNPFQPDPDQPGTAQPTGWDQWSNFYFKYICFGSKVRATMQNYSTVPINYVLFPSVENPATDITISDARVLPYARFVIVGAADGGHDLKRTKHYMTMKKIEGNSFAYLDTTYTAQTDASPSVNRFWLLVLDAQDSADTYSANLFMEITYYVKFYLRKNIVDA